MEWWKDLDEFTTEQLRSEIIRREQAAREHRCWYCDKNIEAHTCKYAKESILPGWEVFPPYYSVGENCMGQEDAAWKVDAKHTELGIYRIGVGGTPEEATKHCIRRAKEAEIGL